ncbi:MAG: hypothetical protein H7Y88_08980 [Phycisphaerales bacterium]|nr:hypothetical protein [Phycisphaerales bacterium]
MTHRHPDAHTPELHEGPDAWHRHTANEDRPQQAHGEIGNPRLVMAVGLGSFFMVAVTCVIVYGYYIWYTSKELNAFEQNGLEAPTLKMKADIVATLERGYTWVDHNNLQLPLETGVQKVVSEYAGRAE